MNKWKVIAIVFIVLFTLETSFLVFSLMVYNKEVKDTNICYYEVCEDYPEAVLEDGLCHCYGYSVLDELVLTKTEIMK